MTTLYVLGSGSSGNAFAIACEEQALLVDAFEAVLGKSLMG